MKYEHVLAEVLRSPWAILPEKLNAIASVLAFRVAGGRLSDEEITSRVGVLRTERSPYVASADGPTVEARRGGSTAVTPQKGVMVIPVYGVIAAKAAQFERMSGGGGTGCDALAGAFRSALANPDISAIVFDIDSPGGSVFGVAELADEIYAERGKKQIVAQIQPLAASAAYWIAAACSEVAIMPSGQTGSIGVFTSHIDLSKQLETEGVATTLISAGAFKTEGHPSLPLTDEAKAAMQQMVDAYYASFTSGVARGRKTTAAAVRAGFGQGRVVNAPDALATGMVDRIQTLDQTLSQLLGTSSSTSMKASALPVPGAQAPVNPATAENHKEAIMAEVNATAAAANVDVIREEAIKAENTRISTIQTLARHTGMNDKVAGWLREGKSIEAVSAEINDLQAAASKAIQVPAYGAQVELSDKENKQFSMLRGIRALCARQGGQGFKGGETQCFEFEVSDAIAKKLGKETGGFYMPTNLRMPGGALRSEMAQAQFNAVLQGTAGQQPGSNLVQTSILPSEFIELLRNMQVCMAMGARKMTDLTGNVQLPKQTGAATLYWTGENPGSAVTPADQAFGNVQMTPHQAMAQTAYSRQFLIQSSLDAEQVIREDHAAIFALGLDLAALIADGTGNQPKGIAHTTGVNTVACGATGGAMGYSLIVDCQTALEQNNIPMVRPGIVTTPLMKARWRKTPELANTISLPIWGKDNVVAGYPAMSSNQLPANLTKSTGTGLSMVIVGDWYQLFFGEWGALEIIADPYTQAGKGNVVLTPSLLCDVAVRYPQAFTVVSDADPTQVPSS